MEVPPRIELGIRELQSHALPLGYGTKSILDILYLLVQGLSIPYFDICQPDVQTDLFFVCLKAKRGTQTVDNGKIFAYRA